MATYCCLNTLIKAASTKNAITAVIKSVNSISSRPKYVEKIPEDAVTDIEYISFVYTKNLITDLYEVDKSGFILPAMCKKLFTEWYIQQHCDTSKLVDWCRFADLESMIIICSIKLPDAIYQAILSGMCSKWDFSSAVRLCEIVHTNNVYMNITQIDFAMTMSIPPDYRLQLTKLVLAHAACTNIVGSAIAIILYRAEHIFFARTFTSTRRLVDSDSLKWLIRNCKDEKETLAYTRKLLSGKYKPALDRMIWVMLDEKKYYIVAKSLMRDYFYMPSESVLLAHKNLMNIS